MPMHRPYYQQSPDLQRHMVTDSSLAPGLPHFNAWRPQSPDVSSLLTQNKYMT